MLDEEIEEHGAESRALAAAGLHKSYGATVALEHADIALKAGKVHALLGENGAGKSTHFDRGRATRCWQDVAQLYALCSAVSD